MKRRQVTRCRERGQAAAEFALMLPVLALIVMGMVDFARVFYTYEALINASREGARYCALNPGNISNTVNRVVGELDNRIQLTSAQTAAITCTNPGVGQAITVTVSATFTPITPLIDKFFNGDIRASATMAATK